MGPTRAIVGRDHELNDARGSLSDPAGSVLCLQGPAGIGKTALAKVVAEWAAENGHRTFWTRCWNGPGTPALWPWNQLLDQLGDESHPLTSRHDGTDRFAQFDAVAAHLRDQAADPLTLVIDDVHWADPASLQLIRFLARDTRSPGLNLVLTYRELEASVGPDAKALADIEREATVIRLAGLDRADVARLLHADASPAVVDLVVDRSAGNPFFVLEMGRQLDRYRERSDEVAPDLPISTGMRSVIEDHIAIVDRPTGRALELAAVQGRVIDIEVLAVALEIDHNAAVSLMTQAARAGLVAHESNAQWHFDHALFGEALVTAMTPHDLANAHLRTADGIEKVHGERDQMNDALANHLLAAGSLVPPGRLLDAARRAAQQAGDRLAWEDQSHHLATAVHALRSMSDGSVVELVDALVARLEVEKRLRNLDLAHDLGMEAAALARAVADPLALARVALAFPPDSEGIEIDDIADPAQLPLREEALDLLDGSNPLLEAQLQAALSLSLYWATPTGDRAESHERSSSRRLALTTAALETARREGDAATLAAVLNAHIHANWGPAQRDERPVRAEELVDVALELGDHDLALRGRVWRIADLLELGELRGAEREIDAFEREATAARSRLHLWTVARWRANLALMTGDLDGCERLAEHALALGCELMPADVAFHFYSTTLGPLQFLRCTLSDSLGYLEETAAASPNVPAWRVGLATAAAEAGDLEKSERELRAVVADGFALLPRDLNFVGSMMMLALTVHHVGDEALGRAVYDQLEAYRGRLAIHGTGYASYGAIDIGLGQAAEAAGQISLARDHYSSAVAQLDATGSPYAAIAAVLHAETLGPEAPDTARERLDYAVARFSACGLDIRADRARALRDELDRVDVVELIELGRDGWKLGHGDVTCVLPALKGFRALRELVTRPGLEIHALALTGAIEGHGGAERPRVRPQAVLDEQAIAGFRRRMAEINDLLDRADSRGDIEESAALAAELAAVTAEVEGSQGFAGRGRAMRSDADRARVNVTKHVRRAIERIAAADPKLGEHLGATVETGMSCVYRPQDLVVRWVTEPDGTSDGTPHLR